LSGCRTVVAEAPDAVAEAVEPVPDNCSRCLGVAAGAPVEVARSVDFVAEAVEAVAVDCGIILLCLFPTLHHCRFRRQSLVD